MLYHLCFVSEFRYQFSHIRHLDSGAALGGFFNLEDFKPGRDIHSKRLGFDHLKRVFLGLHAIGPLHLPGFVEPQIPRGHRGQPQPDSLQSAVDFPGDQHLLAVEFQL